MSGLDIPERATAAADAAMTDDLAPMTTWGLAYEALDAAAPIVVAAELRRLAAQWHATREAWREEDGRNLRSSGLGYAVTAALELADSLDPEGATS